MLKTSKIYQLKKLLYITNVNLKISKKVHLLVKYNAHGCTACRNACSRRYNVRVHSTQSDHHRQKVVIETSQPKIVIDKLSEVLPDSQRKQIWKDKVLPYVRLARWDRPIGVYLLYWPCTWSIALASIPGVPIQTTLQTAALFLVGAGLMRGAGCTINDMWDRDIDKQVARTKDRPLVSGAVSQTGAMIFLAAQLSLALGVLLQLNCYSVALGASSMLLVVTYPLAKRFTAYPQVFLGATFNWGALLGYSAVQGSLDAAVCLPLYAAALGWTVHYDTIYAHQDKKDDARIGIKSTALTFGRHTRAALGAVLAASGVSFAAAGAAAGLGPLYHAAVLAYVAAAARQIYTLKTDDAKDCADKFKSNSSFGFLILLGILGGGCAPYVDNLKKDNNNYDVNAAKSCFF